MLFDCKLVIVVVGVETKCLGDYVLPLSSHLRTHCLEMHLSVRWEKRVMDSRQWAKINTCYLFKKNLLLAS